MIIFYWVFGVLVVLGICYWIIIGIALKRAEQPQDCSCGGIKTFEYVGFFSERPKDSTEKFIPRAYYRCSQCGVSRKLERGEWYDVDGQEINDALNRETPL